MQGNIDFSGTLSGSIAGGGGGGSEVTITPTLQSGTKIADYSIDSEEGSLYAPTPTSLSAELPLSISNNTISIDLSSYDTTSEIASTYATKASVNSQLLADRQYEDLTFQRRDGMSNFQPKLTAGTNISIDSDNVISASGGGSVINYSTSEQDTGLKWIDNKSVYQKVFHTTSVTASPFIIGNIADLGSIIEINGYFLRSGTWKAMDGRSETSSYNNYYCLTYVDVTTGDVIVIFGSYAANQFDEMNVIVRYTKST